MIVRDEENNKLKSNLDVQEEKEILKTSHIYLENNSHKSFLSVGSNKLELNKRTKLNKQMDLNQFFKKKRHFFIMTDGGKPIFSRYGDEVENCGILATFSAMITKFTFFNNTQTSTEKLHYITTDKTTTVFLKKGKLIMIALCKTKERKYTISFMSSLLEYLYIQLLSIVTSDRLTRLEDNPSFCMSALADTDEIFEQMITYTTHTLSSFLNSFHSLVIDQNVRNRLYNICNDNKGEALLCLLLTPYEIIVLCRNESIQIFPHDIVLIQNLIFSSESLKQTESWVPICLPGISDAGYLQIYCNFLEPVIGLVFITESQEHSYFLKFSEQSATIYDLANKENLIENIKFAINNKNNYSNRTSLNRSESVSLSNSKISLPGTENRNSDLVNLIDPEKIFDELIIRISNQGNNSNSISNSTSNSQPFSRLSTFDSTSFFTTSINDIFSQVKYLICKHKNLNQYFTYKFNNFDKMTSEENNILTNYCNLYDNFMSHSNLINHNNFFYYEKNENLSHVIQTNENYILFASFNFFKDFENINTLCLDILKLIKSKEANFFISKY